MVMKKPPVNRSRIYDNAERRKGIVKTKRETHGTRKDLTKKCNAEKGK